MGLSKTGQNFKDIDAERVPLALQEHDQWLVWDLIERPGDKPTKLPKQVDGSNAKSNDRSTWTTFDNACLHADRITGIGFVFSKDDPFCGIDLDGCRNPDTGRVAEWAREIILKFNSYAEVSPSRSGVKIFCRGKSPFESGKKK